MGTRLYHPRAVEALAIWEAIRYAGRAIGVQQFDILASSNPSIERFIRDFAGHLTVAFVVDYERPSVSRDIRRVV